MLRYGIGLLACGVAVTPARAGDDFVRLTDVKVPMSDGVALAADVYLPAEEGRFPALLLRTPYDRRAKAWFGESMVKRGYAVVCQDVRGMGGSQGRFVPFIFERKDGLDTLNWVTGRPWCDGKIGLWGSSYLAYCALIVAPENHPNVRAIVNISGWGDTTEMTAPGGAMHLMVGLPWTLSAQIRGTGSFGDFDWDQVFRRTPVVEIPKSLGIDSAQWEGMVQLTGSDTLIQTANVSPGYGRIRTPIYHITGWYDFVARHTLDVYEGVAAAGQARQKLHVGPWRHDQQWRDSTTVGDEDFGPRSRAGLDYMINLSARWFDRYLMDRQNGVEREKPVKLFVMGDNAWRSFDRWPPREVTWQKWHFGSDGGANGAAGDGQMATQPPGGTDADTFVYDPNDPVPTTGGANFHFFLDNLGIKDQRDVERRSDVLVYTTPPLPKKLTIIGPLQAVVEASTEGRHTDFTAKLVEVRPDGYARIIEDGIKRGPDRAEPSGQMEPGRVYQFTIDMGATAITIAKGHRLRVEISSSNFPKYTRNPNTGERPEWATTFQKVKQTVHHSTEHPSYVLLPVVP